MPKAELHLLNTDPLRKPKHDLTGEIFNRWTVIGYAGRAPGKVSYPVYWMCMCECGKESIVYDRSLKAGLSKSCGCHNAEALRSRAVHGMARSPKEPEYEVWCRMIQRCTNQNNPRYCDYGGRGIAVCESWMSFVNFYEDMGKRPSAIHSIGRIDNHGPYSPTNCRWELREEQGVNKRNNVLLEYAGEVLCLSAMAAKYGIIEKTLRDRIRRGMTAKDAIEAPILKRRKLMEIKRQEVCKDTSVPQSAPTPQ